MTFEERLTEALRSVNLTDRGEPVKLNLWLGEELGLDGRPERKRWRPARFTYVSDKANVRPRLNQFLATEPVVAAAVLGQYSEPGTRADIIDFATARVVGPQRPAEVFVLVSEEEPRVLDVIGDPEHPVVQRMLDLAPGTDLHPIVGEGSSGPVRGPVRDLAVVPLIVDQRLERMLRLAIATAPAVMLVGPPGTGKSSLVDHVLSRVLEDPGAFGLAHAPAGVRRVTAEESWTFDDFVGGQTVVNGELAFRPGFLLQALASDEWLILDEANRADLDKIFGGTLTWLAGQDVQIDTARTAADAPIVELSWDHDADRASGPSMVDIGTATAADGPLRYAADRDWRLIGTYNALDAQRVFRMGQALGRRFVRVPVPPMSAEEFREAVASWTADLPDRVRENLCGLYRIHLSSDAPIGPAVFFRAAAYVVTGLSLELGFPGNGDADLNDDDIDALTAEAYLVTAGVLLAQQPAQELDRVRARVLEDGIFNEAQWTFVTEQLVFLA